MRRSNLIRLIAVVLIISMVAAPVSAAGMQTAGNGNNVWGGLRGLIIEIIRDIFDDWFDKDDPTEPTEPVTPTEPGETEPEQGASNYELQLVEGHKNTENGQLLRGVTYTLAELTAMQNAPYTLSTGRINIGGVVSDAIGTTSLNSGISTMAETEEATYSNIASDATIAVTGGNVHPSEGSANLVDGNTGTLYKFYNAAMTDEQTITLTFSQARTMNSMTITFEHVDNETNNYAFEYSIQARNGEGDYTIIADHKTANRTDNYTQTYDFTAAEYTEIQIVMHSCTTGDSTTNGWPAVAEFAVMGTELAESEKIDSIGFSKLTWQMMKDATCTYYTDAECTIPVTFAEDTTTGCTLTADGTTLANLASGEDMNTQIDVKLYTPSYIVFFPVTMYDHKTTAINNATHAADVAANASLTEWQGIYFNGGTPAPVTYGDGSRTNWVNGGQYYIQSARAAKYIPESYLQGTTSGVVGVELANATLWTLEIVDDTYSRLSTTIDGTKYYLAIGSTGSAGESLTTDATDLTITTCDDNSDYVDGDGNLLQICGVKYLNQHGGFDVINYGGENTAHDSGNAMWFYLADNGENKKVTAGSSITAGFAEWNFWGKNSGDNANGDLFYTGLVENALVNDQIVFTKPEGGIFDSNTEVKDIYEFVGVPFVLNTETGVYSFDSDVNGAYFEGTPKSGTAAAPEMLHFALEAPQPMPNNLSVGDGSTNAFLPFNNQSSYAISDVNYHFGMRADLPFSMTANGRVKETDDNSAPIEFTFSGDDDVWIFIDGILVADMGGIHNRLDVTLNFAENTITYYENNSAETQSGLTENNDTGSYNDSAFATTQQLFNVGETKGLLNMTRQEFASEENHEMQFFYLERGEGTSNCRIEFNLPMRDTVLITKDATKSWSEEQDKNDGDGDGTANLTAKEQAAVDKLNFGFTLYKKTADETTFTAVANTNFYVLDKDGKLLSMQSTDSNGKFNLKNGQTAKFMTDIPKKGVTYYVVEDAVPEGFLTPDYKYAGKATYEYTYTGEAILKDENGDYKLDADGNLTSGTVSGTVSDAADMGEHELPLDATENKSYEITVKGSIESIDSIEFICTNYLDAELPNPSALAYEDIIVIDYGLPVQIDPLANDLFRGDNIEIVAWGDETLVLNEVTDTTGSATEETSWSSTMVSFNTARLGSDANYTGNVVDLDDCLFTFTKNEDETWVISSKDANGNTVYLDPYNSNSNGYPVISESVNVTFQDGSTDGSVRMYDGDGYLFFWRNGNNTYDRVTSVGNFADQTSFYLYAKREDGSYAAIAGKDAIETGKSYLIVADAGTHGQFVVYPSGSTANRYCQAAKISPAESSYALDFGNVTLNDVTFSEVVAADSTSTYTRDTFTYELTEQLTEVEVIHYIIKVTSSSTNDTTGVTNTACRYALAKVYIVPATIMYYEENFSDLVTFTGSGWNTGVTTSDAENVSSFQEPGVVGTIGDSTYGSDVAYLSDDGDSNGTHRFGDTTNGAIRFTYTFTGTGTSFFARTSALTGYMQVKIYEGEGTDGTLVNQWYRDTYWKDDNGTDLDASGTLYNIPVFTDEDLDYGTYTLVCTIAKKGTNTSGNLNGSGHEFYLDGIRIMQPLNIVVEQEAVYDDLGEMTSDVVYDAITTKALGAYATDGESNLDVVTLRYKLITDAQEGEAIWDGENFVVMTDIDGAIVKASDYTSIGPKEEVYLAPRQTVTFSLKYWKSEGLKLYMGMKAPFGSAKVNIGHNVYELKNAPDCYYDVTDDAASEVTMYEQATNADGYLLFTDPSGNEVYMDDTGAYCYTSDDSAVPAGTELTPVDDLNQPYQVITFTFTANENIVSLTNIKVVGSHEFVIIENTDNEIDGPVGEGEDGAQGDSSDGTVEETEENNG